MKEWYTPAELIAERLPDMPETVRGLNKLATDWRQAVNAAGQPLARKRQGRGGGWEYHYSLLPMRAQTRLVAAASRETQAEEAPKRPARTAQEIWDWYERQTAKKKQTAQDRLSALDAVERLRVGGVQKHLAVCTIARERGVGRQSIYNWFSAVAGIDREHWLPYLCPRHRGRDTRAECTPEAWEMLKGDYLRLSKPAFEDCYGRLKRTAETRGWEIPSARTLLRRIDQDVPKPLRVLLREGEERARELYPFQERRRDMFAALEAINADGHKWDVFVRWPDSTVGRPIMVAIQDLYSGKILSWRIDRTENADLVRLAFRDVFEQYGIPDHAFLDNGRGFASKFITGGQPNRYRFKVRPEEPSGVLTTLGVQVHWTRPYSGRSKPIERAFGDFARSIAKHPAFDGAYTGNRPDAKPADYGSKAVPLDRFLEVVGEGVRLHNAKPGRRAGVCGGVLSFDEAFRRSYETAVIRKAGPEQLRMCLLAAEQVRADPRSGFVRLMGNRYWSEFLVDHAGERLTVRFDPDALQASVSVYRADGGYLGDADCVEAAGFADASAAREHARKVKAFLRTTKEAARLERSLSADDIVRLLPDIDPDDEPEAKVVRPALMRGGAAAAAAQPENQKEFWSEEDRIAAMDRGLMRLVHSRDE